MMVLIFHWNIKKECGPSLVLGEEVNNASELIHDQFTDD